LASFTEICLVEQLTFGNICGAPHVLETKKIVPRFLLPHESMASKFIVTLALAKVRCGGTKKIVFGSSLLQNRIKYKDKK
jgi:hypothetical protein